MNQEKVKLIQKLPETSHNKNYLIVASSRDIRIVKIENDEVFNTPYEHTLKKKFIYKIKVLRSGIIFVILREHINKHKEGAKEYSNTVQLFDTKLNALLKEPYVLEGSPNGTVTRGSRIHGKI